MLLVLPIVGCSVEDEQDKSVKNEDKNSSYSEKSDNSEKSTDSKSNKDSEKESKKQVKHWVTTIPKIEPEGSDGLAYIFDEAFTVPIDLSKVEGEGQYFDEIRASATAEDFMIDEYPYSISSDDDTYMPLVTFVKLSDKEEVSLTECYKNNWWYMDLSKYYEMFGIESLSGIFEPQIGNELVFDHFSNTSPALNALMHKIGSPTNVSISKGNPEVDNTVNYELIWENTDYVLEIAITETYVPKEDFLAFFIYSIRYYTPEVWEYKNG